MLANRYNPGVNATHITVLDGQTQTSTLTASACESIPLIVLSQKT